MLSFHWWLIVMSFQHSVSCIIMVHSYRFIFNPSLGISTHLCHCLPLAHFFISYYSLASIMALEFELEERLRDDHLGAFLCLRSWLFLRCYVSVATVRVFLILQSILCSAKMHLFGTSLVVVAVWLWSYCLLVSLYRVKVP